MSARSCQDVLYGVCDLLVVAILVVGVTAGVLSGNGPGLLLGAVLGVGVVVMLGFAADFFGVRSAWLVRLALGGTALIVLTLAVIALVAPGPIADPSSTRGPTTETGARWWGGIGLGVLVRVTGATVWSAHRRQR